MDRILIKFKTFKMIHIAMIFSIIIYGAVIYIIKYANSMTPIMSLEKEQFEFLKNISLGVSFLVFLIIFFLKKALIKKAQNSTLSSDKEDKLLFFFMKYSGSYYIWTALCEIPAIGGILFYLILGNQGYNFAMLLILIALALRVIFSPRLKDIEEMDQKLQYL
ncbi:putative membrane protein [Campylobacter blaseri]|uniref:Uncharacterized protein n=1 Tax=Campylobacter blaseri TaxID=2042961 RepID=A0A2P8R4A5_9BACT|nr:hypothetical protein [Campylobacter blaseri]PSM53293.1 hypothetical protein CQ405_01750 [Campylobacter blaseri]PSM54759.1 hypothetical protein CRN67_01750 [Campylobacter blaseri]QKF86758.1 putative membrane protein [Campylobacter blaseri]